MKSYIDNEWDVYDVPFRAEAAVRFNPPPACNARIADGMRTSPFCYFSAASFRTVRVIAILTPERHPTHHHHFRSDVQQEHELAEVWLILMSALSEETRFKRLKASDADQSKPAVRDGFAAPMKDRRTERGCDDLDAEGAAARRKRREAVSRQQSLIVSGFEQKSVAIAMHVWAQHFADEHVLEGNEEELRLKRKKRKQERKRWIKMIKTEDGAAAGCHVDASEADRFEILWLSFRRMGRALGVYFRIAVTDAILGRYFSDGDDARGGGAGETAAAEIESMATVLIKSCGPDAMDGIRTAYDKLMDGNTNECVRSMALKHLFDAAETAEL